LSQPADGLSASPSALLPAQLGAARRGRRADEEPSGSGALRHRNLLFRVWAGLLAFKAGGWHAGSAPPRPGKGGGPGRVGRRSPSTEGQARERCRVASIASACRATRSARSAATRTGCVRGEDAWRRREPLNIAALSPMTRLDGLLTSWPGGRGRFGGAARPCQRPWLPHRAAASSRRAFRMPRPRIRRSGAHLPRGCTRSSDPRR
jgi:hypothetical protein